MQERELIERFPGMDERGLYAVAKHKGWPQIRARTGHPSSRRKRREYGHRSRADGGCSAGSWWKFSSDYFIASFFLVK